MLVYLDFSLKISSTLPNVRLVLKFKEDNYFGQAMTAMDTIMNGNIQGGPKVSTHTLGLIAPPCFTFEGCCFADGILYLPVRGFRRQYLKIRTF